MSVKIGFIGSGGIAGSHLKSLAKIADAEPVAFCDADAKKAQGRADECGGQAYSGFEEMLDAEPLDAVYICVPPFAHGPAELACISRWIPFFVEKPLGTDMSTVTDILSRLRRSGLVHGVGYMNRYRKSFMRGRELLRGSKISSVEAHWVGGTPGVPWWSRKEQSGGQLLEQTTHLVDAIAYLVGRVTEVYAVGATETRHTAPDGYDVEDATSLTLRFANGAVGSVNSCCTVASGGGVELIVYGPDVVLKYGGWGMALEATKPDGSVEIVEEEADIFDVEDAAFIEAVTSGDMGPIRCSYSQAFHAHQVTMAANQSLQTRQPVVVGG
jgi:myo-inositol 2-dehydrogenase / D-chiro-inositol 1-dehydrogenase